VTYLFVIYQFIDEKMPGSNLDEDSACPDMFHSFSNDGKNLTIFNSDCGKAQSVMHKPFTMEAWI